MSSNPTGYSIYFLGITVLFVVTLLISNTVAVKIVGFGPFAESGATILFPIVYIFGDVLTEVYGFRASRVVVWSGFFALVLMSLAYTIVQYLPPASFWADQGAYDVILGAAPRIATASMCAYLFGEFANAYMLSRMKVRTEGARLWQRTIGSTLVGQGVDTVIFNCIAFAFVFSWYELAVVIVTGYVLKVAYEILATPLTYKVIAYLKKVEGVDVYDRGISYNPFT